MHAIRRDEYHLDNYQHGRQSSKPVTIIRLPCKPYAVNSNIDFSVVHKPTSFVQMSLPRSKTSSSGRQVKHSTSSPGEASFSINRFDLIDTHFVGSAGSQPSVACVRKHCTQQRFANIFKNINSIIIIIIALKLPPFFKL